MTSWFWQVGLPSYHNSVISLILWQITQLRQDVLDGLRDVLLYVDSPSSTLKMAARVKLTDMRERVPSALNHMRAQILQIKSCKHIIFIMCAFVCLLGCLFVIWWGVSLGVCLFVGVVLYCLSIIFVFYGCRP